MKNTAKKSLSVLAIGALVAVSLLVLQKIQTFIGKGLSDSQKLKITETDICPAQDKTQAPQFSGCNTIL